MLILMMMVLAGCKNASLTDTMSVPALKSLADKLTLQKVTFTFGDGGKTLVWWTKDDTPEIRELTAEEASSGEVTLQVLKGSVTPVLVYRTELCRDENAPEAQLPVPRPIGCIWPVGAELTESGGFSARMLWRLLTETDPVSGTPREIRDYCAHFNWKRFSEKVDELENPWELDQQKILLDIAGGTFTLNSLK